MLKQRLLTVKTDTATLTLAEMGEVIVEAATPVEITFPEGTNGLWYRVINVGTDTVTVKNNGGSTLQTLSTNQDNMYLYYNTDFIVLSS